MRFLNDAAAPHELTYDDVFMVPQHSVVSSRYDVDLSTDDGTGATLPIVVANMTAISGRRMAETVARRGGLAVLPQDIPVEVVREVVSWVKGRDLMVDTAITLHPTQTVAEALSLIPKRAHRAAVVVDADGRPLGLVREKQLADVDRFAQVRDVMVKDPVTVPADIDPREGFEQLDKSRIPMAPAVDAAGRLVGLLTRVGHCVPPSTGLRWTPTGDCRWRPRSGSTVTWRARQRRSSTPVSAPW